ncbi:hypothetical protein RJ60_06010 [Mesotoga sp. B105.6.4]|nr:hypothetical protein RJ60_06010 [Mesotoga sp. B105.6.4]
MTSFASPTPSFQILSLSISIKYPLQNKLRIIYHLEILASSILVVFIFLCSSASWRESASITSCRRQPCVPALSSPALRLISPVTGSLSSLVSAANLSMFSFSIVYVWPAQPELATEGDWLVFLPREAGLASPDASLGIATWRDLRQPCVPACS